MKISKIIPNRRFILICYSILAVLYCLHWDLLASWRIVKCTRRLFKVWRNWPNSKLICYSQRGEPRLSFEYKFVGHPWKFQKLYPTVHAGSFKVWRNWPNSKLICYSDRGEPRLSFESKSIGQLWTFLKLYPTVHAYLFFFTMYSIISTENTGKLKECEVHTEAL